MLECLKQQEQYHGERRADHPAASAALHRKFARKLFGTVVNEGRDESESDVTGWTERVQKVSSAADFCPHSAGLLESRGPHVIIYLFGVKGDVSVTTS